MLRRVCFALALVVISTSGAWALEDWCDGHVAFGVPGPADQYLCRTGFAVGYSYAVKAPLWVAYRLTKESVVPNNGRGGDPFMPDIEIPQQFRAELSDYRRSGFDRGHMAPRAALDFTPESRNETFLLSNIVPQVSGLNQEGWAEIEKKVRQWARDRGEVYVVTGAFYGDGHKWIGHGVGVPSHCYKVVYDPVRQDAIAFLVPNEPVGKKDVKNYIVSIDALESSTGMNFLWQIEGPLEEQIEAQTKTLPWR